MLQQVEFYADPQEKISLVDDPEKAYASSVYTGKITDTESPSPLNARWEIFDGQKFCRATFLSRKILVSKIL